MVEPETLLEDLVPFMDGGPREHFASLSKKRPRGSFSLAPHSKPKGLVSFKKLFSNWFGLLKLTCSSFRGCCKRWGRRRTATSIGCFLGRQRHERVFRWQISNNTWRRSSCWSCYNNGAANVPTSPGRTKGRRPQRSMQSWDPFTKRTESPEKLPQNRQYSGLQILLRNKHWLLLFVWGFLRCCCCRLHCSFSGLSAILSLRNQRGRSHWS